VKHSHVAFFLAAALLMYAAANYYLVRRTSQALDGTGTFRTVVCGVIVLLALSFPAGRILERFLPAGMTSGMVTVGSLYLGIFFYGLIVAVLADAFLLANRFFVSIPVTVSTGRAAWIASAIIILSTIVAGNYVAMHPRLRTIDLTISKSAAGLRELSIVAVSDMHLGTVVGIPHLERIMKLIEAAHPDIVLLAGDIFDADVPDPLEREIALALSGIRARYGVFAATGNHEYYGGVEKAVANLTRGNVTVLQDTAVCIAGAFYCIGRKDLTAQRSGGGRKPLEEILTGVKGELPLILMDHQPFHLETAQKNGIDLQVSGHTHNAQLFPLNLFYGLIYEKSYGYLRKGATNVIVSCGAGTWGPPVRTTAFPEVLHIRLHFAPQE
jgi:predicted MPP superfamily phosphohydrolase